MVKYALLVGINYVDSEYELKGSFNDVLLMQRHLIDHEGFLESNILILTDKPDDDAVASTDDAVASTTDDANKSQFNATYNSIVTRIKEMINISLDNDLLFFYFTGHGTQIADENFDEEDNKDEVFVTSDYNEYVITDDFLKILLSKSEATVFTLFDCCNSGTLCDLKYNYSLNPYSLNTKLAYKAGKKMASISACSDSSDSYEKLYKVSDNKANWFSIFTYSLVEHLTNKKETFSSLIDNFKKNYKMKRSVISFSDLDMENTGLFENYIPTASKTSSENDINNDNNVDDRISRLEKINKTLQKTIINKDLLLKKYKSILYIKDGNHNPFSSLLYSINSKN